MVTVTPGEELVVLVSDPKGRQFLEKGLSDLDLRHNLIANFTYMLPIGKGHMFLGNAGRAVPELALIAFVAAYIGVGLANVTFAFAFPTTEAPSPTLLAKLNKGILLKGAEADSLRTAMLPELIFDDGLAVLSQRQRIAAETKADAAALFVVDLLAP